MFDDLTPNANQSSQSEPEDMLAPVDGSASAALEEAPTPSAGPAGTGGTGSPSAEYAADGRLEPGEVKSALAYNKLKPVAPGTSGEEPALGSAPADDSSAVITQPILSKKGITLIIVIVAVILVGVGGVWAMKKWSAAKKPAVQTPVVTEQPPVNNAQTIPPPVDTAEQPVAAPATSTVVTPPPAVDTDGDGLTDQDEAQLGTDPAKADTDGDGLSDYEEIIIWKTNPLNPDSDGDTFSDGTEVKNGYNPLGAGKLLELPKQ